MYQPGKALAQYEAFSHGLSFHAYFSVNGVAVDVIGSSRGHVGVFGSSVATAMRKFADVISGEADYLQRESEALRKLTVRYHLRDER